MRGDERRAAGVGPGGSLGSCIEELVAAAPPLTSEQRDKLALLLRTRLPSTQHSPARRDDTTERRLRAA